MAFVQKNLERVGGGLQKLFMYSALADTIATVAAADYFGAVRDELDAGDVIIVKGAGNTTIDSCIVTSARSAASVTVATAEGITAT